MPNYPKLSRDRVTLTKRGSYYRFRHWRYYSLATKGHTETTEGLITKTEVARLYDLYIKKIGIKTRGDLLTTIKFARGGKKIIKKDGITKKKSIKTAKIKIQPGMRKKMGLIIGAAHEKNKAKRKARWGYQFDIEDLV